MNKKISKEILDQSSGTFIMPGEEKLEFDDVAIYFSENEWDDLHEEQKELYKEVMMENYQTLLSLGLVNGKPMLVSKIQQGEEPYMKFQQDVKEEEIMVYIYEADVSMMKSSQLQHYTSHSPTPCVMENIGVTEMLHGAIQDNYTPENENRYVDKELNAHLEVSHIKLDVSTLQDNTSKEVASTFSKKRSEKTTNTVKHQKKKKSYEYGDNSITYSSRFLHQSTLMAYKPFTCSDCGKLFNKRSALVIHERFHSGVKPFACSECTKCFTLKSDLVKHERIHTGLKPFACFECGKCFTQKSDLLKHEQIHTGVKPFPCSECGKCFRQKSDLVKHDRVHTGVKPFACSECGLCFSHKSNLYKHERIHSGLKPFTCSECGKCFSKKSNLGKHEIIHTGRKPFACAECGKCFTQKSDLTNHERIHTCLKPFACSECAKCFRKKSNLVNHKRVHKGIVT